PLTREASAFLPWSAASALQRNRENRSPSTQVSDRGEENSAAEPPWNCRSTRNRAHCRSRSAGGRRCVACGEECNREPDSSANTAQRLYRSVELSGFSCRRSNLCKIHRAGIVSFRPSGIG